MFNLRKLVKVIPMERLDQPRVRKICALLAVLETNGVPGKT